MAGDTPDASHITDHPFLPSPSDPWWARCMCGLSEAAHRDRDPRCPAIVLGPEAKHNHPVVEGAVASLDCPACFTEVRRAQV